MTLYEKYQTLLKRGMPEHPHGSDLCALKDAEDLITMHALRWAWLHCHDIWSDGEEFRCSTPNGNGWRVSGCFLDAIIAATEHLPCQ